MKKALLLMLCISVKIVYGQQTEIKLPDPNLPKPLTETAEPPTIKAFGNTATGFSPVPPPEVAFSNRFKDIPVNLYTGTPIVNLPLYTLSEAGMNVPISLNYNSSGMKAHEVATWCGIGWSLNAGGMITRVVQDVPDEGKLELTSLNSNTFTHLKGYHLYGHSTATDNHDHEPDIFYLNIGGASYKFIYQYGNGGKFIFFPDADIDVQMQTEFVSNASGVSVYKISKWIVTMPDGTKYEFNSTAYEQSAEIEVKYAQTNSVAPWNDKFTRYWKTNAVTSAWYLTKIISPYGHEINFDYKTSSYSFFRLAENEANGVCPQPADIDKKINRVYVRTNTLSSISSRTIKVEFNKEKLDCNYINPETGETECVLDPNSIPSRKDIDSFLSGPVSKSDAKKLVEMNVMDNVATPTDTLKYSFEYDHFISVDSSDTSLPSGYTISDVGKSHVRRLKLKQVNFPDSTNTKFNYYFENAPTTFYSRLSYAIDHWGFLNGYTNNKNLTGLIPRDFHFPTCTNASIRDTESQFAKYGLIEKIVTSTGSQTNFDYEAHEAENYKSGPNYIPIGGSRIKQINQKDLISGIETIKKYNYLTDDSTKSSGFLVMKPIYRFHKNTTPYSNSGLYDYLLNQSGRPVVSYSHVAEKITTNANENVGFSTSYFDLSTYEATIKTTINCTPCDTVFRPELYIPEHDYIGGTLLKTKIFNSNRNVIAEQSNEFFISGYDFSFVTYGTKVIRFNSQYIPNAYGIYFRKYRSKKAENVAYSPTGTDPVTTKTEHFYKDEMNGSYQAKYPGKHNFVVRTQVTDVDGFAINTWNKYVADYVFDRDTTICTDPEIPETCSTSLLVQPNTDADALYEMKANHLLSPIVESYTVKFGFASALYNSYRSFSNISSAFKYNLKESYVMDSVGKNTFFDAVYKINIRDIEKDLNYYSVVQYQDYNPIGLPLKVKPLGGAVSKITYDALNVLPLEQIQNYGGVLELKTTTEFDTKIFGVSKQITPNLLELRSKYYADTRFKQSEDKDGFILSHYEYRYKKQALIGTAGTFTTDTSKNRVVSRIPRIATSNPYQDVGIINTAVNYSDGSGRNLQSIGYKISPTKNDIVSGTSIFDSFGRPNKNILPVGNIVGNGVFQNSILPLAQAFYGNDSIPYSQVKQFEASPLSRVFKAYGVGGAFRPNSFAEQKYETGNFSTRKYEYIENSDFLQSGFYTGNQLFRETSIDERGNIVRIITDKLGRTIEKQVQYTGDGTQESHYLKTAYVYDRQGRLAVILPPKVYDFNPNSITVSNSIYTKGIYIFKYDHRGRLVAKHTPDASWSYIVYNQMNQIVMSQNARQKQNKQWVFGKSDAFGRSIISGVLSLDKSQDTLQKYFDTFTEQYQYEDRTNVGVTGYSSRSFPSQISIPDSALMVINYYDDYSWKANDTLNFKQYKQPKYNNGKGLMTGNKVRNLKTKEFLRTVMYYDDKNRLIQSKSENRFSLINQTDNTFDFIGQLLEERTIYRKTSKPDIISKTKYQYDHVGRKVQAIHQLNNNAPEILASYDYDEIGRMIQKNLNEAQLDSIIRQNESLNKGVIDVAKKYILIKPGTIIKPDSTYCAFISSGLQRVKYAYNIRGNLRGINLTPSDRLDSSKVFSLKLDYFEDGRYFDGNLSRQSWKTHRDTTKRSFVYDYDKVNRVTAAAYTGKGTENYSLSNLSFDNNGNIKNLTRKGFISANNWNTIDNLTYSYTNPFNSPNDVSSKLYQVADAISPTVGIGDFKNNASLLEEYLYYADGSLKTDLNKGIDSIRYNFLNLPTHIFFDPDKYIENIYTADGVKISQKIVNGTVVIQTDYIGDLLYRNDTLVSILHDEGKIRFDTSTKAIYQYFITDHLGNTRVIFEKLNDSTYTAQENHYGAWGEVLQGLGTQGDWDFLYQGKEFVDAFGYNSYDFHARGFDSNIGRFDGVDAVDNHSLGGYIGMMNNPTSVIDPDGQNPVLIGAAFVGGLVNFGIDLAKGNINSFGGALLSIGKGAAFGLLSGTPSAAAVNGLSSLLPSANVSLGGGFSVSVSPAILGGSQGLGLGVNVSTTYQNGDFSIGVSSGFSYGKSNITNRTGWESRIGAGVTFDNGKVYASLSTTQYNSGETSQRTGIVGIGGGGFNVRYENDYHIGGLTDRLHISDAGDRWRTAALQIGYKDFSAGFNLFTGDPGPPEDRPSSEINGKITYDGGNGRYSPDKYRFGAAYVGYKNIRIGANSEKIRHVIQNRVAHDMLTHGSSKWFKVLNNNVSAYTFVGSRNPFSLW